MQILVLGGTGMVGANRRYPVTRQPAGQPNTNRLPFELFGVLDHLVDRLERVYTLKCPPQNRYKSNPPTSRKSPGSADTSQ